MHKRPISSLSLPPATLGALTRAGFETIHDLSAAASAEALSTQLGIPIAQSQLIITASQATAPRMAASQSLALLSKSGTMRPMTTLCKALDYLLDGGLRPGRVYELSGPPGAPKDALALKMAVSYLRNGEGTLLIEQRLQLDVIAEAQKLISTTTIHKLAELVLTVLTLPALLNRLPEVVSFLST
ncbi:hypothetical protein HDZ31DRAFT_81532 [Schizophyllum fasciatum]